MAQLKPIGIAGWLKDVNDNFEAIAPVGTMIGLGNVRVAHFEFDGDVEENMTTAAHGTGVTLPASAIICGGFLDVTKAFTSGGSATLAISVESAADITAATAYYSTTGMKAIKPKANTPETTNVKVGAAAKEIVVTVAGAALTAGKLHGYLFYVEGEANAA